MPSDRPVGKEDRRLLERFLHLARQAYELKHGKFNAGSNWSARDRLVGMGRPNYHVRRLLFELATLRSNPDAQ